MVYTDRSLLLYDMSGQVMAINWTSSHVYMHVAKGLCWVSNVLFQNQVYSYTGSTHDIPYNWGM